MCVSQHALGRGGLPRGCAHGGVCVPGGVPMGVYSLPPPDAVNKRAVRILLECILVFVKIIKYKRSDNLPSVITDVSVVQAYMLM